MRWSIQEYCARNSEATAAAWNYSKSTQEFLSLLDLPTRHPFCEHNDLESFFSMSGIPPMGPLDYRFEDESLWEKIVTLWLMVAPPLLAMAELWLRLVAGLFGPLGCVVLLHALLRQCPIVMTTKTWESQQKQRQRLGMMCLFTIASSLVLMTDTYYVLNNGPVIGMLLFLFSVLLSVPICLRYSLNSTAVGIWILVLLAIHLIWDTSSSNSNSNNNNNSTSVMDNVKFGNPEEQVRIPEGLYYDSSNAFIQTVVHHWPERYRTYSIATGATPWMPSGDSRTGLPFLINRLPSPHWHRVFLPVLDDKHNNHNRYKKNNNDDDDEEEKEEKEYVALDIAFPTKKGFLKSQPLYLVLHGLNGGSNEEYIRDFTFRRLEEGSTVVVMIARGLMDLPVRGWNMFHGARVTDVHAAALALQKVIDTDQVLIGVGYSMGAIVLSNYVASSGIDCALDGAISISGGLDMRFQEHFGRAQRLWQPMLAETLRSDFLLGKWGIRVHERLSKYEMLRMMRATHITEIDKYAVVPYNGFRDLNHYYTSMSALGDIPLSLHGLPEEPNNGKIHSISIPLCVVHAFDDPLITWRTTVHNNGFMHPENLVKSGSGNVMLLLTKSGGHVGWPMGMIPSQNKWKWMSDVAMSFGQAVAAAKRSHPPSETCAPFVDDGTSTLETSI